MGMMTREYPPEVYGGAGVHVTELTRFMREIDGVDVDVHCMGEPRDGDEQALVLAAADPAQPYGAALAWPDPMAEQRHRPGPVSYTHLRAHETLMKNVSRLLLEKKKKIRQNQKL